MANWQLLRLAISLKPYLIVFTASACVLIIEIVAARLLAPTIGVSLYTWTSIIGVVLTGISVGNYLGGRVADRFPSQTTLGLILLSGGVSSLSVLPLLGLVSGAFLDMPYVARIVFLTATLFFLPSLILGMVTPLVIKLRLHDLAETGNIVGKIYAVSTTGSIFGTFITGFVLIQWVGTRSILILVALVLVFLAVIFGNLWPRAKLPGAALLALFFGLGFVSTVSGALDSDCTRESNYYCIKVEDALVDEGRTAKRLYLDALLHSYVSLEDPTLLAYSYETVYADIANYVAQRNPNPRVLFIGGGGYTMPRYLEVLYPQSALEVIEIDPEVTSVAFEHLGLWPDTLIVTHNEDARMAIPRLTQGQYDLVIGDAFNDVSIPFHLTTREFNEQVKALLNDEGIYAVNVIDKLYTGRFLRAYINTLQRTFPNVYLIRADPIWEDDSRNTFVVVGSFQSLSSSALEDASIRSGRGESVSNIMPEDALDSWLNSRGNILLTDDYAPVDNLVAPLHLQRRGGLGQAAKHYNAALEFQSQGQIYEAIAEFSQAITLDPAIALAYSNRGQAYATLGQYPRAIEDYDEAIRLVPQYAMAHYNRGHAYDQLGQYQRAIRDFDEAIRLNSTFALAYHNRGTAYATLGQYQQALRDYDEAIRLEPEVFLSYYNRGTAYITLGQFQKAIRDYDEAIRLNPEFALAHLNRGTAYEQLGNKQQAIRDYNEAIRLNPQNALAYHNRGSAYVTLGQFQLAIQDLDQAIRLDPLIAGAYTNRGIAYGSLGQFQQAIQDLDEAIRLNPSDARAYTNRGTSYGSLGQYQKAIPDLNEAIRLDPHDAATYDNRGSAFTRLGNLQLGIQDFDQALRLDPQYAPAYYNRGTVYGSLGEFQQAIQDLGEAIRLNPQDPAAHANRAIVYTRMDMDAQAQQDVDRAAELGFDRSFLEREIEELKRQR